MAPPLTLTFARSALSSFCQARTTEANASLISTRSMSSSVRPARSRTLVGGGNRTGQHRDRVDAREGEGVEPRARPCSRARWRCSSLMIEHRRRAVGDLRGVAGRDLAVLLEGGLQLRERFERSSRRGFPRRSSSSSSVIVALVVTDVDRDDLVVEASLGGRAARRGGGSRRENSSSSSREMPHWSAIISAPMPWLTSPPTGA